MGNWNNVIQSVQDTWIPLIVIFGVTILALFIVKFIRKKSK
ncbi:hypothetical protein [Anaeromicropila herbilytica]|uniref:Uncharacterized protein n=1 Tax=Anaeromicropila herbilytica TaxID=2785025 RepID=A0A7R7EJF7_9FIRM|nr:hypothetical protein [Anaeromicropila herbilytica]BCN29893.1 hypothetical protein bsdtb5_11880 [Anaeromicropila herbilytica]